MELSVSPQAMRAAVELADPDLIICPFLRERVPAEVWQHRPTIIIHPGPKGDRGPSSLDWAITDGGTVLGRDRAAGGRGDGRRHRSGRPGRSRSPAEPPRKSALYNGPVADAARRADPRGRAPRRPTRRSCPSRWTTAGPTCRGRLRPPLRQPDRAFAWSDDTEHILRRIRAADGSPGVRTDAVRVAGPVLRRASRAAARRRARHGRGQAARRGAGPHRRRRGLDRPPACRAVRRRPGLKLPATMVLADRLAGVPEWTAGIGAAHGVRTTGRSATGATGRSAC